MRTIHVEQIIKSVKEQCIEANYYLCEDILNALVNARQNENNVIAKDVLAQLIDNASIAREDQMAICQDTGMAVIFVEIGQDVHIIGGAITDAINTGVKEGYAKGYLRNSIVKDPIRRENTNDNTPAVIYYDIVEGNKLSITVAPKGFGSENTSVVKMLRPCDGVDGIKDTVINAVKSAGASACPPLIVGVGIGGTMEKAAILSKKALLRPVHSSNALLHIQKLEQELFEQINLLGIGPAGLGGETTAIGVNIEIFPTHIAGLPVAINIGCNATRHCQRSL